MQGQGLWTVSGNNNKRRTCLDNHLALSSDRVDSICCALELQLQGEFKDIHLIAPQITLMCLVFKLTPYILINSTRRPKFQ